MRLEVRDPLTSEGINLVGEIPGCNKKLSFESNARFFTRVENSVLP